VETTGESYLAAAGGLGEPVFEGSEGAQLFQSKTCITCHGSDGQTPLLPNYPMIAGQGQIYSTQQMLDIKSGARANGQSAAMAAIMATVSDEEINILADYIANELVRDGYVAPETEVPMGKKLFRRRTCFTCHGMDGNTPIMDEYPRLAGQNPEYALQQMKDIHSGARNNGQTIAMQGIIHLVNDEEMAILAEYISQLEY
jgi:cytochrome c553